MLPFPSFRNTLGRSKRLKVLSQCRTFRTTAGRFSENEPPTGPVGTENIPGHLEQPFPSFEQPEPPTQPSNEQLKPLSSSITPSVAAPERPKPWAERLDSLYKSGARLPRSVQAVYLQPLKRKAQYGLPVCDLQLRSYDTRHVEFFADFALRAAYYLGLPASGPVPLPRITERWTVLKSHFIFKKTQENFERITLRRLIQIRDGHPETVQVWLAFLRKHAFHGVGMKANVWEHAPLDFASEMDKVAEDLEKALEPELALFGTVKNAKPDHDFTKLLETERFSNSRAPMQDVRKG